MDGNLAGLIFLCVVLFGKLSVDGYRSKSRWEIAQETNRKQHEEVVAQIEALKIKLDEEYLLRVPHLVEHEKLNTSIKQIREELSRHSSAIMQLQKTRV